jgi:eukaryotic-like serine/threonine-protein kinase
MRAKRFRLTVVSFSAIVAVSCSSTNSSTTATTQPATNPPSAPASSSGGPAGFSTFSNPSPAFTISYPQAWKTNTQVSGAVVAFLAPQSTTTDTFAENVNVLHQTVANGMTLKQYTDESIRGAGQIVGNFQQVSLSTTTLSGLPGEMIEYQGVVNGKSYRFFAEWTLSGTDAWVLTYSAEPESYDTYLPDARTAIESFKLG